jgi:hypothetical protein
MRNQLSLAAAARRLDFSHLDQLGKIVATAYAGSERERRNPSDITSGEAFDRHFPLDLVGWRMD